MAQLGSALRSGRKGHRFKSGCPDVNSWWSWLLFVNGAFGLWLYTVRPKIGPWFNIAGQSVWIVYAIVTRQWGFIASAMTYISIFSWMLYKAHKKKQLMVGIRPDEEHVSKACSGLKTVPGASPGPTA